MASVRVVMDLGTGDGRWIYRLARRHPHWCCVGIDASADRMREASFRAGRKPSRGGAPSAWFIRASVECLPDSLVGLADEIHVMFPWGSLLQAVLGAHPDRLAGIIRLGKAGARVRVCVNVSALPLSARRPSVGRGHEPWCGLQSVLATAGISVETIRLERMLPVSSWGRRLAHGGPIEVLALEGHVSSA